MKKIIISVILMLSLAACSVQENMSSELFFERFQKYDNNISINSSFYQEESYVCFSLYHNAEIIFEIKTDSNNNAVKINLACSETDKINEFTDCAESVIRIYSPNDTSQDIIENLFYPEKVNNEFRYFNTQWHTYSAVVSDNGLFFSVSNKKLMPENKVEFSLKQNDIVEY